MENHLIITLQLLQSTVLPPNETDDWIRHCLWKNNNIRVCFVFVYALKSKIQTISVSTERAQKL